MKKAVISLCFVLIFSGYLSAQQGLKNAVSLGFGIATDGAAVLASAITGEDMTSEENRYVVDYVKTQMDPYNDEDEDWEAINNLSRRYEITDTSISTTVNTSVTISRNYSVQYKQGKPSLADITEKFLYSNIELYFEKHRTRFFQNYLNQNEYNFFISQYNIYNYTREENGAGAPIGDVYVINENISDENLARLKDIYFNRIMFAPDNVEVKFPRNYSVPINFKIFANGSKRNILDSTIPVNFQLSGYESDNNTTFIFNDSEKYSLNFTSGSNDYIFTPYPKYRLVSEIEDASTISGYMPLTEKPNLLKEWKWGQTTVTRTPRIDEIILPVILAGGLSAVLGAIGGSGEGKIGAVPGALVLGVPVVIFGGMAMMSTEMEFEKSIKVDDDENINTNRQRMAAWKNENETALENNQQLLEQANSAIGEANSILETANESLGYLEIYNKTTGRSFVVYPGETNYDRY